MKEIDLEVTKEHFRHSIRNHCTCCLLGRALQDRFPGVKVLVNNTITVREDGTLVVEDLDAPGLDFIGGPYLDLPQSADDLANKFELGKLTEDDLPVTVKVLVPEELL